MIRKDELPKRVSRLLGAFHEKLEELVNVEEEFNDAYKHLFREVKNSYLSEGQKEFFSELDDLAGSSGDIESFILENVK